MNSFRLFVASFVLAVVLAPAMMGCKPADPIPTTTAPSPTNTSETPGDAEVPSNTTN
jgi:hypothetical protein